MNVFMYIYTVYLIQIYQSMHIHSAYNSQITNSNYTITLYPRET